jgi:hypothetical protein
MNGDEVEDLIGCSRGLSEGSTCVDNLSHAANNLNHVGRQSCRDLNRVPLNTSLACYNH